MSVRFIGHQMKNWRIRAFEPLPIDSFVFEFVGKILTNVEMENQLVRCLRTCKKATILNLALDANLELNEQLDDSTALCLDASFHGNVAQFLTIAVETQTFRHT
jgi:hypothetical protein